MHDHEAVEEAVFTAVGIKAPVKGVLLEGGALDRAVNFLVPYSWGVAEAVAIASDLIQRSGEATRGLDDGVGRWLHEQRQIVPFS